jgi:hypothetical protein
MHIHAHIYLSTWMLLYFLGSSTTIRRKKCKFDHLKSTSFLWVVILLNASFHTPCSKSCYHWSSPEVKSYLWAFFNHKLSYQNNLRSHAKTCLVLNQQSPILTHVHISFYPKVAQYTVVEIYSHIKYFLCKILIHGKSFVVWSTIWNCRGFITALILISVSMPFCSCPSSLDTARARCCSPKFSTACC